MSLTRAMAQTEHRPAGCFEMQPIRSINSSPGGQAVMERQQVRAPYPTGRVIVLNDDHNTFQHVVEVLVKHIPGMSLTAPGSWPISSIPRAQPSAGAGRWSRPSSTTSSWPPRA